MRSFKLEARAPLDVSGAFKNALIDQAKDSDDIIVINSEAVVDFFTSRKTGFIYASEDGCSDCAEFGARVAKIATSVEVVDIYHYEHDANNSTNAETTARNVVIGREDSPVLIYVRDGVVYDRLDDINSESDISIFLAKYK